MSKIATEQEALVISGGMAVLPEPNKCVTKSRAESLGCKVSGTYQSNQLVQNVDLSAKVSKIQFYFGQNGNYVCIYATSPVPCNVAIEFSISMKSSPGMFLTSFATMNSGGTTAITTAPTDSYDINYSGNSMKFTPSSYNGISFVMRGTSIVVPPSV